MGISAPEIAEAKALQASLEAETNARKAIHDAIAGRKLAQLLSALEKAAKLGLLAGDEAVKEGEALKATLEAEAAAVKALTAAGDARELGALEAALAAAEKLGLAAHDEYKSALGDATELLGQLKAEKACKEALVAATASSSEADLSAALGQAAALGLAGPELAAANDAMAKLQAKAGAAGGLKKAVTSTDVAEVEAAIAKAESEGISDGLDAAKARLAELKTKAAEEKALIAALVAATKVRAARGFVRLLFPSSSSTSRAGPVSTSRRPPDRHHRRLHRAPDERWWINLRPKNVCLARESNDLEALSKGLSTVNKMGLTAKYTAEVTAAKEVVAQLSAQDDARAALVSALAANEVADIEAAIAAMEAAHVGPSEVRAAHKHASAENTTTARRARARATEQTKRARRASVLCGDDARRFLFRLPAGLAGSPPSHPRRAIRRL